MVHFNRGGNTWPIYYPVVSWRGLVSMVMRIVVRARRRGAL